jgi:hypothetical protein
MTTTTNASLTDRYVAAALKGVQADQRDDVAAELHGSIADAVEVRTSQGQTPDAAERAVLLELGDPTRLAAGYSGRPLYLIGPAFYPDYIRLLRLLLSIVVPIIAIVVGGASAVSGADPLDILLGALGSAFSVGVQLAFWVTVVFALVDRSGAAPRTTTSEWDLDDLPEPRDRRIGLGETVASVTGLSLLIWFLLWQPGYQESFDPGGPSIPILDPGLSSFWIPALVAVLLASIAFEIVSVDRAARCGEHGSQSCVRPPGAVADRERSAAQSGVPRHSRHRRVRLARGPHAHGRRMGHRRGVRHRHRRGLVEGRAHAVMQRPRRVRPVGATRRGGPAPRSRWFPCAGSRSRRTAAGRPPRRARTAGSAWTAASVPDRSGRMASWTEHPRPPQPDHCVSPSGR